MRKSIFNEEKAKRLRAEGMSYFEIAKRIDGASHITIYKRLNPKQHERHKNITLKNQRERKERLIKHKGGKCCICGYDKCATSLSFHHIDPKEKSFGIGDRRSAPLKEILKELEKTILVCNNCHGEVHAGLHDDLIENENKNRNRLQ